MICRTLMDFVERMRKKRNFSSQEEFVDGIIDARNYRRYKCGNYKIHFQLFEQFIKRLNVPYEQLLNEFLGMFDEENDLFIGLYNASIHDDFEYVDSFHLKHSIDCINRPDNRTLYLFSRYRLHYKKGVIDTHMYIDNLSELISFPIILKKELIGYHEFLILSNLLPIVGEKYAQLIIEKLKQVIDSHKLESLNNFSRDLVLLSIADIARHLLNTGKYEESADFCNKGISICSNYKTNYLRDYFYFYLAYYYAFKNNPEKMMIFIRKCVHIFIIDSDPVIIDFWKKAIFEALDVDISQYIEIYQFPDF